MASRVLGLVCALLMAFAIPAVHAQQSRHTTRTKRPARPYVATAYCRGHETAMGTRPHEGIAAADPDVIPMGTLIRVSDASRRRIGTFRVMDTGRKIQGRRVDLFLESCARAKRFGRKPVHVVVLH